MGLNQTLDYCRFMRTGKFTVNIASDLEIRLKYSKWYRDMDAKHNRML